VSLRNYSLIHSRQCAGEAVQREAVGPGRAAASSEHRSAQDPRDRGTGGGAAVLAVDQTQRARGEEQLGECQTEADGEHVNINVIEIAPWSHANRKCCDSAEPS